MANTRIKAAKRYEVKFVRNGAKHKAGNTASVGIIVAKTLYAKGLIGATTELKEDAKKYGHEEWFASGSKTTNGK